MSIEEDEYGIIEAKEKTQTKEVLAEDIKAAVDEVLKITRESKETKTEWEILAEVLKDFVERQEKRKSSPVSGPEPGKWGLVKMEQRDKGAWWRRE
jgi:hypothetical protein